MARPKRTDQYAELAKEMVRGQATIYTAAAELELDLTNDELTNISKSQEFRKVLSDEKNRYYDELANQPGRSKATAIGMMLHAIENLIVQGEYDKAVAAIEKLGKLEGWLNAESNINVFAGLTARDIAEAKERLKKQISPPADGRQTLPN